MGTTYDYTIVATNNTTGTLTNLIVTDTVPAADAEVADVMDGGILVGDTITWTVSSLGIGEAVEVALCNDGDRERRGRHHEQQLRRLG